MKRTLTAAVTTAFLCLCVHASAAPADGEAQFRELYKELVETNTTPLRRQLHAGRRAHGGAPEGGRLSRTSNCTSSPRPSTPRRAAWWRSIRGATPRQGDPAAGAPRRRRGQARGLDARSLHARRGERQLLRARRGRRQGRGGDLGRHPRSATATSTSGRGARSSWRSPAARRPAAPSTAPSG